MQAKPDFMFVCHHKPQCVTVCACCHLLQGAVATTPDAKGMFPEDHEQYIGKTVLPVRLTDTSHACVCTQFGAAHT